MVRKKQMTWCAGALLAAALLMSGCSNSQKIDSSKSQTGVSTEADKNIAEGSVAESSAAETKAQESSSVQVTTGAGIASTEASSAEVSDQTGNSGAKRIVPLPETLSVDNLKDCTIEASFDNTDIFMDGGALTINLTVYDYEKFDMVDISQMKEGDTLVIDGKEMQVNSLEEFGNGVISVNGGLEEGGCDLWSGGDGVYQEVLMDSGNNYYPIGTVAVPVDEDFRYYDQSNLDKPQEEYYAGDLLTMTDSVDFSCQPNNSMVRIANGKIIEITKIYMP